MRLKRKQTEVANHYEETIRGQRVRIHRLGRALSLCLLGLVLLGTSLFLIYRRVETAQMAVTSMQIRLNEKDGRIMRQQYLIDSLHYLIYEELEINKRLNDDIKSGKK